MKIIRLLLFNITQLIHVIFPFTSSVNSMWYGLKALNLSKMKTKSILNKKWKKISSYFIKLCIWINLQKIKLRVIQFLKLRSFIFYFVKIYILTKDCLWMKTETFLQNQKIFHSYYPVNFVCNFNSVIFNYNTIESN